MTSSVRPAVTSPAILALLAILATGATDAAAAAPAWPGGTAPGDAPAWLAPGLVTTEVLTRDLAVTPDGDEMYFAMAAPGYAQAIIAVTRRGPDGWSAPEAAPFSGDARWLDLEPCVAPDGGQLYFMSTRNEAGDGADDPDLWVVARTDGGWGEPRRLGPAVNTPEDEYFPSVTADGTLYFTRADSTGRTNAIWRARPDGRGGFADAERLPDRVNTGRNRFNAWAAPDGSRLILSVVGRPENHGLVDYWQVRRGPDGAWAEPENLGARINAGLGRGWSACVTPDGSTLAYMAAPAPAAGWPRTWGELQARAAAPGAAGGIAVIRLDALDGAGPGTASLATAPPPRPFPVRGGAYLGEEPPGTEPRPFAPGVLSTGLHERDVLVHPGGREIWYGLMDQGLYTVLATRLEDGRWTEPASVPFHRDPDFVCFEPTLAADGSRVLFLSNRAAPGQEQGTGWDNQNIFMVRRTADGWSEAAALPPPVTTDAAEYFPSLAADGTLYFTREDDEGSAVWSAEPQGEGFAAPRRLPPEVNVTGRVYNATVAPDESWLIACVIGHAENLGRADYWISVRDAQGRWRPARNLGPRFNGPDTQAASASLSPDGRFLFFSSQRRSADPFPDGRVTPEALRSLQGTPGAGSSDLWWVDAAALESFFR